MATRLPDTIFRQSQVDRLSRDTIALAEAEIYFPGEGVRVLETLTVYIYDPSSSETVSHPQVLATGNGVGRLKAAEGNALTAQNQVTQEPTGFEHPGAVGMTYDAVAKTITLTAMDGSAYYQGRIIPELVVGWESEAHGALVDTLYFLYYDAGVFSWSIVKPKYKVCHLALVYRDGVNLCKKECHGFMQFQVHEELHNTIGTYRLKDTGQVGGYVLDSTVVAERRPTISEAKVFDEDIPCILPGLTNSLYAQLTLSGANDASTSNDNVDILPLSGSQPYYNEYTGGTWVQTLMPINDFGNVFVLAVPTTDDAECQKNRFIFIQPQAVYATQLAALGQTADQVSIGHIATAVEEFVFIARIVIKYSPAGWSITEVSEISGTRVSQLISTANDPAGTAAAAVAEHEVNGEHDYEHVATPTNRVIGSPTAPLNLLEMTDSQWSAGVFSTDPLVDNGDGTINAPGGTGYLRTSSGETAPLVLLTVPASVNLTLTDNSVNYIYADYNGGSPLYVVTNTVDDFNCQDKCVVWRCSLSGGRVKSIPLSGNSVDANRKLRRQELEQKNISLNPGTAKVADEGSRYFSVSPSASWLVLSRLTSGAFDTSASSVFDLYYGSGTTWAVTSGRAQINNLNYNDGTTTPATLTINRATVLFLYLLNDEITSPSLAVISGGDYKTPEDAAGEDPPAILPAEVGAVGVFLAKITIGQGGTEIHDILGVVSGEGSSVSQVSHNAQPGLQPPGAEDYYHLDEANGNALQNYTLPLADGTAGQSLKTDGNGSLYWG